jgi:hypothetical protein
MKVLDLGHRYLLEVYDGEPNSLTSLRFVKRVGEKYPGNKTSYAGTNSQEVLRALVDRAIYVNHQRRCWQTRMSIYLMMAVIWLYEHRAARQHGRKPPGFFDALYGDTCATCGHVHGNEFKCR